MVEPLQDFWVHYDPYPARRPDERATRFECEICGAPIRLVEEPDGEAVVPSVSRFVTLHGRCLRHVLTFGGVLARPSAE